MPALVELTVIRPHPAQPDFAETGGAAHQFFNRRHDLGVADQFVKLGGGNQSVVVSVLMMAVGVPEIRMCFAILFKEIVKIGHFGRVEQLAQVHKAILSEKVAILLIHLLPCFSSYSVGSY